MMTPCILLYFYLLSVQYLKHPLQTINMPISIQFLEAEEKQYTEISEHEYECTKHRDVDVDYVNASRKPDDVDVDYVNASRKPDNMDIACINISRKPGGYR
ncbi:uncharacterized protein LOC106874547 [Octopus bimaculoides]|uniref:uncharacterized protein LOC106874547 n=1 Tax=Octopus bimaculoides TaxID=37653 RepID=UPI0022E1BF2C|nr:uncharacterized protein LOC106874547 [Octopus bimaculoides]